MKTAGRIFAVAAAAALALWGMNAAIALRTCGDSDAAVEQLLRWELRGTLGGETIQVIAGAEAEGPAGAAFALRAFQSGSGRPGLAVFCRSGDRLKLESTTLWPHTEWVLSAYDLSLYSPDRLEEKGYNVFLVLNEDVTAHRGNALLRPQRRPHAPARHGAAGDGPGDRGLSHSGRRRGVASGGLYLPRRAAECNSGVLKNQPRLLRGWFFWLPLRGRLIMWRRSRPPLCGSL